MQLLKGFLLISFCLSLYLCAHNKAASCFTVFISSPFLSFTYSFSSFFFLLFFLSLMHFTYFVRFLQLLRLQENIFLFYCTYLNEGLSLFFKYPFGSLGRRLESCFFKYLWIWSSTAITTIYVVFTTVLLLSDKNKTGAFFFFSLASSDPRKCFYIFFSSFLFSLKCWINLLFSCHVWSLLHILGLFVHAQVCNISYPAASSVLVHV